MLLTLPLGANDCEKSKVDHLKDILKSGRLVDSESTTRKHKKLTDHDYPISCEVNHNHKHKLYKIYTDQIGQCIIIRDLSDEQRRYFGVYCT